MDEKGQLKCIVNKWVKNRIERQNILLQETRLSGISREVGSLNGGITREQALEAFMIF